MTVDEMAERMAAWLRTQSGVSDVEIVSTDNPPFGADPTAFIGKAYLGFQMDGLPMSLELGVTE